MRIIDATAGTIVGHTVCSQPFSITCDYATCPACMWHIAYSETGLTHKLRKELARTGPPQPVMPFTKSSTGVPLAPSPAARRTLLRVVLFCMVVLGTTRDAGCPLLSPGL